MSSGSVYDQTDRPSVETDTFSVSTPRSFYAASKLAAELLLEPYSAFLDVIQLRLFTPHGSGQDERMLLPLVAGKVRDGAPLDLHGPDGLLTNPTAITDVAEAVRRCLSLDGSHILNLGGPEILSLRQMAELMGRLIGREPTFNIRDESAPVIVGDTTQLRKTFKWAPPTRFAEGLREWLRPAGG
jgi:nucleoside-diphosphate-sugar epimerase